MAKKCRVQRDENGRVDSVDASNGNKSLLFEGLNNITNSPEKALELYAITETSEFKEVQEVKKQNAKVETLKVVEEALKEEVNTGEQNLEGIPKVEGATGVDLNLSAIAKSYALENGIEYQRQPEYVKVNVDTAKRIAQAYEEMEHNPQDPKVKEAYQNLITQTKAQYDALIKGGYQFYFYDETNDPYQGNPWNAMRDLRNNKTMASFSTEGGYGSNGTDLNVEDNPMLVDTGLEWGFGSINGEKRRVLANDLFRAVHDAFGHGLEGAGFRARGEENAWQSHARLFTGSAVGAITSETRGQNSWLNYGKYGEQNKTAKIEDTIFADQKIGLMPEWTWTEGFNTETPKLLTGGASFSKFFSKITNTKDGGAKFDSIKDILQKSITGFEKELEAYLKYGKNFQKHIMASIPGFLDARIRVLKGMVDAAVMLGKGGKEVAMLDITSSEGYFTKAFAQVSQDKGVNATADALDAGVTFERDFNETPKVKGVKYLLNSWGDSFVDPDSGKTIPSFKATKKYEIVHECMGFQFFTATREQEIAEVKSMMAKNGMFVTMQKHKNQDYKKREILKDEYKAQFFSQEEMAQKAATVLTKSEESSVGMMDYQYDRLEYEKVLSKNFKYVAQFYSSGNFSGYLASDNREVITKALESTGDTTTKFNEEVTPKIIQGDVEIKNINKETNPVITPENSSNYANLTEDGEGNFIFYHVGKKGFKTIKKGTGQSIVTSKEEGAALRKVGGMAMYYTRSEKGEAVVTGESKYVVKVPIEKVYDFNNDSLNLLEEAKERHSKENPGKAFDVNTQLAYITKIAGERGFEMVVAQWGEGDTRAQTTQELEPSDSQELDGNTITREFENNYISNKLKGYSSIIPISKAQKLQEAYEAINKERNKTNTYDDLYRLYTDKSKYTQEEITQKILNSNISEESKNQYKEAVNSKEENRRSEKKEIPIQEYNGNYYAMDGEKVMGRIRTKPFLNGFQVDEILVKEEYRDSGMATQLYGAMIKDMVLKGKKLYSDDVLMPYAKKIWEKLEREQIAKKVGDRYEIISQLDQNNEPSVKTIIDFATNSNNVKLSSEDVVEVQNAILAFGLTSSNDLKEKLSKALLNSNGIISFNANRLKDSGLYNNFEVSRIMSSPDIQNTIKEILNKLKNSEDILVEYDNSFVITNSNMVNSLGKQGTTNPFELEREITEIVAGMQDEEILNSLDENVAAKYLEDPIFKEKVNTLAKNFKKISPMQVVDGKLEDTNSDVSKYIGNLIIDDINDLLTNDITFLRKTAKEEDWLSSEPSIRKILDNIKDLAINNGIDLKDFSQRTLSMTKEEVLAFLDSMGNMLEEASPENIKIFSDQYNIIFNTLEPTQDIIQTDNVNDTKIETDESEYNMFKNFGMVKKSQEIYRKVTDQSLEELYQNFFANKDNLVRLSLGVKETTIEDLKEYVQKNLGKLAIEDYNIDTDILEKMFLYKSHFGFNIETKNSTVNTENLSKVNLSEEYLLNDFLKEFNQFILITNNKYFTINEKGIILSSNDPITKSEAILTIPEELMEPLAQYDYISKNLNLGLESTDESYEEYNYNKEQRNKAINNPQSVPKLTGEYTYLEGGILVVKNEANNFVKTPTGIYEMVYESKNVKFYGELPKADLNYKIIDTKKPLADINFGDYTSLENTPELFKEAKNYYSQKELEKINEEYFSCK